MPPLPPTPPPQADRAETARRLNVAAVSARQRQSELISERDRLIRLINLEGGWSYGRIARAVGISKGLVAQICRPNTTPILPRRQTS